MMAFLRNLLSILSEHIQGVLRSRVPKSFDNLNIYRILPPAVSVMSSAYSPRFVFLSFIQCYAMVYQQLAHNWELCCGVVDELRTTGDTNVIRIDCLLHAHHI